MNSLLQAVLCLIVGIVVINSFIFLYIAGQIVTKHLDE